jgi:S1-C subfamily serine protease
MKYIAVVSLLVATMSAQNAPNTDKGRRLDIPAISREANGAVVSIIMSDNKGQPIAQGSGFVVTRNGLVVTNYHVIKNGTSAVIKLPDGSFFTVDGVLAFDKDRDIAVIKAHGTNFKTVALGDSDRLQVGEDVVAIGSPLSLESTVSNGIVSGIRTKTKDAFDVADPQGGQKILQITAPISHGSSCGPLFNLAGEVVGITSAALVSGENLNFAVPINAVKPMLAARLSKASAFPDEPESVTVSAAPAQDATQPSAAQDCYKRVQTLVRSMINGQMGQPVKSVWDYTDACDPKRQSCYFWLSTTSWDQTSVMQGHLYVYEHFIVNLNSDHVDLTNPLAHWKFTTTPEISETAPGYLTNVNACEIDGDLVCVTFDKFKALVKQRFDMDCGRICNSGGQSAEAAKTALAGK